MRDLPATAPRARPFLSSWGLAPLFLAWAFCVLPLSGCAGGGAGSGGEGSVDLVGAKNAAKANAGSSKAAANRGAKFGDASQKKAR